MPANIVSILTSESLKKADVSAQFTKSNHDMQSLEVEMQTHRPQQSPNFRDGT